MFKNEESFLIFQLWLQQPPKHGTASCQPGSWTGQACPPKVWGGSSAGPSPYFSKNQKLYNFMIILFQMTSNPHITHKSFFVNKQQVQRDDDPSLPETLYKHLQTWIQTSCSLQGYLEWCFNKNVTNTSYPSYKWGLAYPGSSLCSAARFFRGFPPFRASCPSDLPFSPHTTGLAALPLFFFF